MKNETKRQRNDIANQKNEIYFAKLPLMSAGMAENDAKRSKEGDPVYVAMQGTAVPEYRTWASGIFSSPPQPGRG